jgi:hypothetical protein
MGRDEQMRLSMGLINSEVSWDQPEELIEKMDLNQQVQLIEEEEDQEDIMMIGGIGVFLPCAQEEAKKCVADDTTNTGEQSVVTVKKKLEQTFEIAQADEGKNEHYEERFNDFSQ